MNSLLGQIISHYRILEQIGQGGMGVLYLAEDLDINRKAVLKFLPPEMANDLEINQRFKREAQSAGSLSHPNIVTIYDVGVHEGKTFIAMEYVEGKNLKELIKSEELTIEKITDISIQICEGLNEAHEKRIIHRDIKPENILIDEKGKVKIVDFGLAKISNLSQEITKQGSTVGTLKYMSPEQIRNQKVDQRSDIWSMGVVLYEMITGRYPFKGEHDASIFYSIISQTVEPLARYKSDVSERFQRIIDKSLEKNPETRYQHIVELLSDLKREKRDSGELKVGKESTKKTKKRIPILISIIALIVISITAPIYLLNKSSKKVEPLRYTQLTFSGNIFIHENGALFDRAIISPDGQFTVYVVNKNGEKNLYLRDNSSDAVVEIYSGIKYLSTLKWSPSGNEIYFSDYNSYIISRLGGNVKQLKNIQYGCWSPDGSILAGVANPNEQEILFLSRETNEIINTVDIKGDYDWIYEIDWSSINNKLLLSVISGNETVANTGQNMIIVFSPDGIEQKIIFSTNRFIFSPRWSNDGEHIYYLQSNGAAQDLMKLELSEPNKPEVVLAGLHALGFSITRDNKRLCYTDYRVIGNLRSFIFDEKQNKFHSTKITSGTSYYRMPALSSDAKSIIFSLNGNIHKMLISGESITQLSYLNTFCYSPRWSPDNKKIAFRSESNIYTMPIDGGTPTIIAEDKFSIGLEWISDTIILCQKPENRNFFIYELATKEKRLLVQNDSVGWMFNPRLNSESEEIAIRWNRKLNNKRELGIWILSLKDSSTRFAISADLYPLKWSKKPDWIYAIENTEGGQRIVIANVNTAEIKPILLPPPGQIDYSDLDISSDGQTFVCTVQERITDVWLIENFDQDVE